MKCFQMRRVSQLHIYYQLGWNNIMKVSLIVIFCVLVRLDAVIYCMFN